MVKTHIFIATSTDGFIAKEDGSVDWLNEQQGKFPEGEDGGFAAFMASVDCIVMGRKTFEQVVSFGEAVYPYGETPIFVLSRGAVVIPAHLEKKVSQLAGEPQAILATLEERGLKEAYIDGGSTIQCFLDAGLVSSAVVTEVPVILGTGIPLFKSDEQKAKLQLQGVKVFDFDSAFVQKTYALA
eukprot:CAMPEP_0170626626 /NCGR_PEP_ID=MMETSP0224-20130122/31468_1 /TAXON_ID=285029 /ORGANISM="Togula jolla, Strain CCCM 725" /LENGTH=183 /DNA_ID=CAMNT_0010953431 /DNA_START=54 /DNA_END=605 /DNA_ORIENTATION=+